MRYEIDNNTIPEAFYRLLRLVEEGRFYTNISFRIKPSYKRLELAEGEPIVLSSKEYRLVISRDASVLLRPISSKDIYEIILGNLAKNSLREIIDHAGLFTSRTMVMQ